MVFASLSFLLLFLIPVVGFYYILPEKFRNYELLAASIVFYMLDEPVFVLLLLSVIVWSWLFGIVIERAEGTKKKLYLFICIAGQVSVLAFFKYGGYLGSLLNDSFQDNLLAHVILPVGISFYMFQAISYAVDVYRGTEVQKNPFYFGLYLSFFPQLIAGPIVRYTELGPQLKNRKTSLEGFSNGVLRFTMGLCKKVLIANTLGQLADHVFNSPYITEMSSGMLWLAALAYTLQIYFDFSGYSDMAIGLGAMFGFRLPENFNYPYISGTATEFWRRWHMTLSRWFRDYVYIPLGGNRKGFRKECLFLMVVWGLTGIWHGAGGTFLLWGLLWGLILILEKGLIKPDMRSRVFKVIYRVFLAVWIVVLWVIFRSPDLGTAGAMLSGMFLPQSESGRPYELALWVHDMWPYLTAGVFLSLGGMPFVNSLLSRIRQKRVVFVMHAFCIAVMMLLTVTAFSFLVNSSYNPFLYFNF